jgi:hypothetical protein
MNRPSPRPETRRIGPLAPIAVGLGLGEVKPLPLATMLPVVDALLRGPRLDDRLEVHRLARREPAQPHRLLP